MSDGEQIRLQLDTQMLMDYVKAQEAAASLECSKRQMQRIMAAYQEERVTSRIAARRRARRRTRKLIRRSDKGRTDLPRQIGLVCGPSRVIRDPKGPGRPPADTEVSFHNVTSAAPKIGP